MARAGRAIRTAAELICSTLSEVAASKRNAHQRPIRSSRKLTAVSDRLADASALLERAEHALARTRECIARDPEVEAGVPEFVAEVTASWVFVSQWLGEVVGDVSTFQQEILDGLETGTLVPEQPARPRIVIAPRPVPVRAFLRLRQRRAVDRIASILRRRRRTPRPAAVDVPPETHQGRAPPFSSLCLL